ncbi:alpha-ketoglutarate-dependent dioxygenase AlkB [Streptomyces californicus]|uniref:alpha-ketoglutarate-dependent dioxygenase AlkB n=1 Tax=Streptomyces californicus TaxID=67351 RepID=UPI0034D953B8
MAVHLQSSLFDQEDEVSTRPLRGIQRTDLGHGAWIDVLPQWLRGADTLFASLVRDVGWRAEQRVMYERVVAVPRLLAFFGRRDPLPHPSLEAARTELSRHYAAELGEPFTTAGLCLYRDGRDGVAWHGDTVGRGGTENTMVAILSLGAPRHLALRPREPGPAPVRRRLGHGDLIVMGGSCQRTWEHAVPKSARVTGARVSVQFRPDGVR